MTLNRFLSSYVTTIVLLLIYALLLGMATFIEKYQGTEAAKAIVYYSPVLFLVQVLFVFNFIAITIKHRWVERRKWGVLVLHTAFVVILAGALTSHLFGEEGILHLREGEKSNQLVVRTSKGDHTHTMPFTVELVKFTIQRYPGSNSPSSYQSDLLFHVDRRTEEHKVFMNNVVDMKGYRFFQASYDRDEKGTILSVNRDVAGRYITYTGYLLLGSGFLLCFFSRNGRFRTLNRRLKEMGASGKTAAVTGLLFVSLLFPSLASAMPGSTSMLQVIERFPVDRQHAALFGSLPVQSSAGRMMPVNTFSSEVLRKIHKSDKIGSLNSDQFLISLLAMRQMWEQVPFIAYSNSDITTYFGLTPGECSYAELFDISGRYRLEPKVEEAYSRMPAERTAFDKELIKLDEKAHILFQLFQHGMLNLFPLEDDPNNKWYAAGDDLSGYSGQDSIFVSSIMTWYIEEVQRGMQEGEWDQADAIVGMIKTYQVAKNKTLHIEPKKLEAEIRYNRLNPFRIAKICYLILGGLLLVLTFTGLFNTPQWLKWAISLLALGVLSTFVFQTYGMGMRWYIGGYAPWSNSYETMIYIAWASVAGGLLFVKRSPVTFALATLFAGIILFVSGLNWMDPQINTLVPVLKSPWLMFHVAIIVAAYGFFGISFLIGMVNMVLLAIRKRTNHEIISFRVDELTTANEMSLIVGVALMTAGTFIGAVWANESWGRYWGWDPKETWALITMVIYAIVIHLRLLGRWYNNWLFNFASVISFGSVLMTYFGVNYLLSGMHSYGNHGQVGGVMSYILMAVGVIVLLALLAKRGFNKQFIS